VETLLVQGDRCVGVRLGDGELRADAIVLAAGSWSSLVPGIPAALPTVRPVRGQIVLLEERPPQVRSIVFGKGGYVVPRGDGRVLCGSTMEQAGFRKEVTAAGVQSILERALACVPSLGSAQVAGMWSNFRPYVEGEHALVGASPLDGLFLATGHYRNGILLAKVTADAVADAILA
jgi:glycine oxidase